MKKISFLSFLIVSFLSQAQIIDFPDSNFKNALTSTNCVDTNGDGIYDSNADLNNDGEIQVSEAEVIFRLDVSFQSIVSLEGIANFVNLTILYCTDNPLTELDVSSLINLEVLGCWDIDEVTTLDFSSNINLISLECDSNDSLEFLNIQNGFNENLLLMWADNLMNLQCIQVDDVVYANNQTCGGNPINWCKENSTIYSENCVLGITSMDEIKMTTYPNPVKNELNFKSDMLLESIQIYSLSGRLVMNKKLQTNKIDISNLDSGIYFIKIKSQNNIRTKKIIKE